MNIFDKKNDEKLKYYVVTPRLARGDEIYIVLLIISFGILLHFKLYDAGWGFLISGIALQVCYKWEKKEKEVV